MSQVWYPTPPTERRLAISGAGMSMARMASRQLGRLLRQKAARRREQEKGRSKPQKTMPRAGGGFMWNNQALRASKRVTYKKGGKLTGNKKDVYVPKRLRAQVKEVIEDEKVHGAYYRRDQCHIGFFQVAGVPGGTSGIDPAERTTQQHGLANQYIGLLPAVESNASQQWWGCGILGGASSGFLDSNAVYNNRNWIYFTPKQILSAASQLFNNKVVNEDYMSPVGDIATVTVPGGAKETVFKNQGLKILVENAYVKYEMRNNAERPMIVDFYQCVQKERFQESTPLNDYIESVQGGGMVDTALSPRTAGNRVFTPTVVETTALRAEAIKHYVLGTPLIEPNQIEGFNQRWRYTKTTVLMQPGEICSMIIQGPRNYELDWKKLYTGNEDNSQTLFRDTTVCVMAKVRTDTLYAEGGVVPTPADTVVNGRGTFSMNAKQDVLTQPISINETTVIKLKMPDVAGATTSTTDPTQITLNSRVPRKVFVDLSNYRKGPNAGVDQLLYKFSNEENPNVQRDQVQSGIYG